MSRSKQNRFPIWMEEPPPSGSYRSIFKWGAPDQFKHPNKRLFQVMKERFHMTDADFEKPQRVGNEAVQLKQTVRLSDAILSELRSICGAENVKTD
ncbi:MAG: hypothetical protein KDK34_23245, partial [Leptospiraceae bacterium]|nr:hypothetical protein [Leptospiraceae bacterium]